MMKNVSDNKDLPKSEDLLAGCMELEKSINAGTKGL
jgi:hypothetical protein